MPPKIRPSSCVLVTRGEACSAERELFWARRGIHMAFLGGFFAFPGGAVEASDADVPVTAAHGGLEMAYLGCAARELFEEAGLLLLEEGMVSTSQGIGPRGAPRATWRAFREELVGDGADFAAALEVSEHRVAAERYRPLGRWSTPEWVSMRFETEFFHVHLTDEEAAQLDDVTFASAVQDEELEVAEWTTPADALQRHARAEVFLSAPTIALLRHLDAHLDPARCDMDGYDPFVQHELAGGIQCVQLASPTLAPATHTPCYGVGGRRVVVIDPGSQEDAELAELFAVVDARRARGAVFEAIVLTHHHIDHVCGVSKVRARYPGVPVRAHTECAAKLAGTSAGPVDALIEDGERIDLGDHALEAVFTPGHAPGHLAFVHHPTRMILAGDMVASQGTILVRPPDGHMGEYMASLRTLLKLEATALLPAHGVLIVGARQKLERYLAHRQEREDQVLRVLRGRGDTFTQALDLVSRVYADVPQALWPVAAFSLLAHLEHLVELGVVEREDDGFRALEFPQELR